ncbi:zinc finger CCCH domain-containing protein 3-like isoform X1 [Gossypium australe]|uniref:Zinc finger CCCH domain-containing protein 3-like isoform X1 n=1 Tax=Gossypium australe TaxID=47621 RepID=A0A5B6UAM5_9ROSI|nr:zinc finger CCCH domain-containing protein 3-like isoform X1 [Gossypium australe]
MPLGKYYCDYCDKQFQDTPAARKRHLQGLQHLRAKAQWFHSQNAQDLYQTSVPPFSKGVCNRFLNTGFCQYGDNCKYFHPNNDSRTPNPPLSTAPPGGVEGNGNGMAISWGNLPPSLKPPPEAGYPPLPFVDWG